MDLIIPHFLFTLRGQKIVNTTPHLSTRNTALTIFGALIVLTLLTVGVTYLELTRTIAITVALLIAFTKISLVVAFFMHLKYEKKIIHWIFYTSLIFVMLLLALVLPDIGL